MRRVRPQQIKDGAKFTYQGSKYVRRGNRFVRRNLFGFETSDFLDIDLLEAYILVDIWLDLLLPEEEVWQEPEAEAAEIAFDEPIEEPEAVEYTSTEDMLPGEPSRSE